MESVHICEVTLRLHHNGGSKLVFMNFTLTPMVNIRFFIVNAHNFCRVTEEKEHARPPSCKQGAELKCYFKLCDANAGERNKGVTFD